MTNFEKIYECLEQIREDGFIDRIIDDYSGRGMFGRKCVAIVPEWEGFVVGLYLGRLIEEVYPDESYDLLEILQNCAVDQFGRGEVIYFPRLKEEGDGDE